MKLKVTTLHATLCCATSMLLLLSAQATPTLHWKLDEAAGTTAADSSGNAADGTWQGTAGSPAWVPGGGIDGGSVAFSGANVDAFLANDFFLITGTPFTMSTWVKTTSTANDTLVYVGDGGTNNSYYTTKIQAGTPRVVARNTAERQLGGLSVNDGEWHHITSVYTSSTERTIYVDGVFGNTTDVTNPDLDVAELTPNRFGLGALTRGSGPVDLFTGELDDTAVWDRALTATEVAALNGLGVLRAGNAGDMEGLVDAFTTEGTVEIAARTWEYTTGLVGILGDTGGSLANFDAYIVLDDLGNGMQLSTSTGAPLIISFATNELVIFSGESATLSWNVDDANSIAIDQGIGAVANPSGSVMVSPTATTTYTLTATNGVGSVEPELTITVISDPVISSFTATPGIIFAGEEITLTWDAANFTNLQIDQGIGPVTGAMGNLTLSPTEDTTYTFTAINASNTVTSTVTVLVYPTPPARELLLHWPFDEGSGTSTADLAGTNDGQFLETGGTIDWTAGVMGGGVLFPNAVDVSVRTPTSLIDTYPFTMAGWVNTTATENDTFMTLGTGGGSDYYSLRVSNGNPVMTRRNGAFFDNGSTAINDGGWHFVVGVYTHPQSRTLYVDGLLASESVADSGVFGLPDRFGVGALDRTDASIVDGFNGTVDDVSFWRGILSAEEVANLYGGAIGLGLNASDVDALLSGFESQSAATAAGLSWTYTTGLTGALGETSGTLAAGNATIILDASGNGMVANPLKFSILNIVSSASGRTITWESTAGSVYRIDFSRDLTDWSEEVSDGEIATSGETTYLDPDATRLAETRGYYRVVLISNGQ